MKIEKNYDDGAKIEANLDDQIQVSYDSLTADEREMLPKVLFPETHVNTIKVLGKERELHPVPIKISKKISQLLQPFIDAANNEQNARPTIDEDVMTALVKVVDVLCRHYGESWNDIRDELDLEDVTEIGLSESELEAIAYGQAEVNGVNDFFLHPLRLIVKMLQGRAIASVMLIQRQWTNLSITLPSQKSGE